MRLTAVGSGVLRGVEAMGAGWRLAEDKRNSGRISRSADAARQGAGNWPERGAREPR